MVLLSSADFFFKLTFKKSFRNTNRMSDGLDPDLGLVQIWVQTVCKGYHETAEVVSSKDLVKMSSTNMF